MIAGRARVRSSGVSVEIVVDEDVFDVINELVFVFMAYNNDVPRCER